MKSKGRILIVFTIIIILLLALLTIVQLTINKVFGKERLTETLNTEVTFEPNNYINKESENILVIISNSKGIKSIKTPNQDTIFPKNGQTKVGIDYTVTQNGTMSFVVIDNEGNEETKHIEVNIFDRVEPKDFTPKAVIVKTNSVIIKGNAEDGDETEDSVKSGIVKYEYFVNEVKIGETEKEEFEITGLVTDTSYNIHLIAYDKAGNTKRSQTINIVPRDILYIYNLEDLKEFRDNVNNGKSYQGKTVHLMSDIDLEGNRNDTSTWWNSIGRSSSICFSGTFEGNGHKISNLYMSNTECLGLFGYLYNASIKKLTIENGSIFGTGENAGLLATYATNNCVIEDCSTLGGIVSINYKGTGGGAGGLIGIAYGEVYINRCKNSARVSSNRTTGGIIGRAMASISINECSNYGIIISEGNIAAGIFGSPNNNTAIISITNSYNCGEINAIEAIQMSSGRAASGIACISNNNDSIISNCYNRGKLTGRSDINKNGGILSDYKYGKLNNNYYLSGMGADYGVYSKKSNLGAMPKTETELKNLISTLGSSYVEDTNNINEGYPILYWEINR